MDTFYLISFILLGGILVASAIFCIMILIDIAVDIEDIKFHVRGDGQKAEDL